MPSDVMAPPEETPRTQTAQDETSLEAGPAPIGDVILYSHPTLAAAIAAPTIVVVMGVSGSGKSTVALLLAHTLGWAYQEGDDLHPPENVAKMKGGTPLTDADRLPWLQAIAGVIEGWRSAGQCGVVTCSALKRAYREIIVTDRDAVRLAYLRGSKALIHDRMARRHEHFMPVALLDSQFATLEEPTAEERPIILPIDQPPAELMTLLIRQLAAERPGG
jgi:carbohydrate kinase (thermoresistant glucokinase family)